MLCFRYITCLAELLSEVVCKIQFHLNESWLSEIDMETLDDDVCILSNSTLLHFFHVKMSRENKIREIFHKLFTSLGLK